MLSMFTTTDLSAEPGDSAQVWSFYAKSEQGLIRIDELTPGARVVQKPHP